MSLDSFSMGILIAGCQADKLLVSWFIALVQMEIFSPTGSIVLKCLFYANNAS